MFLADLVRRRFDIGKGTIHINVQPVADYYYESDQEFWDIEKDMPNIAPPFPFMWMEWKIPSSWRSEGKIVYSPIANLTVGSLIQSFEIKEGRLPPPSPEFDSEEIRKRIEGAKGHISLSAKWLSGFAFFIKHSDEVARVGAIICQIAENGSLIRMSPNGIFLCIIETKNDEQDKDVQQMADFLRNQMNVPLLSTTFLHCKNVEMIVQREESERERRHRTSLGRAPLTKIYTLDVGPIKKIFKSETGEGTLSKRSLHVCRGHFKDFRSGAGLFGRHKEIYWWPMQLRGNASEGIIEKDYRVKKG